MATLNILFTSLSLRTTTNGGEIIRCLVVLLQRSSHSRILSRNVNKGTPSPFRWHRRRISTDACDPRLPLGSAARWRNPAGRTTGTVAVLPLMTVSTKSMDRAFQQSRGTSKHWRHQILPGPMDCSGTRRSLFFSNPRNASSVRHPYRSGVAAVQTHPGNEKVPPAPLREGTDHGWTASTAVGRITTRLSAPLDSWLHWFTGAGLAA